MSQMSQDKSEEVILNSSSSNTRNRSRKWCLTLNNYTENELSQCLKIFNENKYNYIIGKEKGLEGTPHLQIYLEHKTQIDFNTIKKFNNRFHIEKAKGTQIQNLEYCSKEGDYITNFKWERVEPVIESTLCYKWHFELEKLLIENKPNFRTIYWYWSQNGSKGKSRFVRYMLQKHSAGLINKGKYSDVINQIFNYKNVPKIILMDIPRALNSISYASLEDIKNGCIANSKYETGFKIFNPPHIVVFCNFPYDTNNEYFSEDRIIVKNLDEIICE